MKDDLKAWKKMVEYNKQDIVLLEKVYYALRPWDTYHPNMGVYLQENVFLNVDLISFNLEELM